MTGGVVNSATNEKAKMAAKTAVEKIFSIYDVDNSGYLDPKELKSLFPKSFWRYLSIEKSYWIMMMCVIWS